MSRHRGRLTTVASARRPRRATLIFTLFVVLGGLALLHTSPVALAHAGREAHTARAASGGPVVNWASSMIYAGQNNGNPEGPVGELAEVVGSGFTVGASVNLILAPGDSSGDPTVCQSGAIPLGSDITVQNDGTFTFSFTWPNTANAGDYSVCALNPSDGSVLTGADGGPFHVLSANQPTIQVSNASVAAGNAITVTGSNWLPPQPVSVLIGTCHNCGASPIVNATPNSDSNGAFSVLLAIPAGTAPGSYVASAFTTNNDVLDVGLTGGAVPLTVTAAAPVATATTQATPTTAATTTTGGGVDGQNTSGGADNTPYIIAIVVAVVILLLALVGLFAFVLLRRRGGPASATGGAAPSQANAVYGGPYIPPTPPGGYVAPGGRPSGVAGANTPPDWRVLPNWGSEQTELFPGGAPGVSGVPSVPGVSGVPSGPTPPTPPLSRPSPTTPGAQAVSAPFTQSTQPAIPNADADAPTLPGNFPG